MRTVAVITATTGRKELEQTVESVANQTYPCKHYVFFDGVPPRTLPDNVLVTALPVKTGANGMMNGGIVAACAYIVQEELICWCDDDNWMDENHVESLVAAMEENVWSYSLRKLMHPDGSFWDYDDCESLGHHTGFVDLNCYMMDRRRLACGIATCWYHTTGELNVGDRHVWEVTKQLPGNGTGQYTMNYRLNNKRDLKPFFFQRNIQIRAKFGNDLPWRQK